LIKSCGDLSMHETAGVRCLPQGDLQHVLDHTRPLWESLRGESIFLTGATGFIGSWLLESLLWISDRLNLGCTAVVLSRTPDAFRARLPHLHHHPAVSVVAGDVQSFNFPEGEFAFVIHAATDRTAAFGGDVPLGAFERDVAGTRRVLEFARTRSVRRLLFTSSGAVYGHQPPTLSHVAEDYPSAPLPEDIGSAYGHAKRVSELMCIAHGRSHGFDALIARLFAFVGPRLPLDAHYAVGNFIRDALDGNSIRISGDGTPYRSYLYAADLSIWIWTILFRGVPALPYNVGSTRAITISELARIVQSISQTSSGIEIAANPIPGLPAQRYVPATTRAEQGLGLEALISLEEGVRRTFDWHREAQWHRGIEGRYDRANR